MNVTEGLNTRYQFLAKYVGRLLRHQRVLHMDHVLIPLYTVRPMRKNRRSARKGEIAKKLYACYIIIEPSEYSIHLHLNHTNIPISPNNLTHSFVTTSVNSARLRALNEPSTHFSIIWHSITPLSRNNLPRFRPKHRPHLPSIRDPIFRIIAQPVGISVFTV